MNKEYPNTITIRHYFGGSPEVMTAVGIGKFPYDCSAKNDFPNAMIYQNEKGNSWLHSEDELYKSRFIELDKF